MTTPPKKILIDASQVLELQQAECEFKSLLAMMEKNLADPQQIEAICIHESMHMYYLIKAGVTDFIFKGPTITYDDDKGFDHTGASIQAKTFDKAMLAEIPFSTWAFSMGKACVGAGIAVEKLCPRVSDYGDIGDVERFDTVYEMLSKKGFAVSKEDFRKECERLVRAELDTVPGLKDYILKLGSGFMRDQLFTWI